MTFTGVQFSQGVAFARSPVEALFPTGEQLAELRAPIFVGGDGLRAEKLRDVPLSGGRMERAKGIEPS